MSFLKQVFLLQDWRSSSSFSVEENARNTQYPQGYYTAAQYAVDIPFNIAFGYTLLSRYTSLLAL